LDLAKIGERQMSNERAADTGVRAVAAPLVESGDELATLFPVAVQGVHLLLIKEAHRPAVFAGDAPGRVGVVRDDQPQFPVALGLRLRRTERLDAIPNRQRDCLAAVGRERPFRAGGGLNRRQRREGVRLKHVVDQGIPVTLLDAALGFSVEFVQVTVEGVG
jgi:hypothetical protein